MGEHSRAERIVEGLQGFLFQVDISQILSSMKLTTRVHPLPPTRRGVRLTGGNISPAMTVDRLIFLRCMQMRPQAVTVISRSWNG